jgi:hypothetical protein
MTGWPEITQRDSSIQKVFLKVRASILQHSPAHLPFSGSIHSAFTGLMLQARIGAPAGQFVPREAPPAHSAPCEWGEKLLRIRRSRCRFVTAHNKIPRTIASNESA